MYQFRKYEIKEKDEQLYITLYLDMPNVEFASEFTDRGNDKQEDLEKSAKKYIRSKFPNIKNATVKIMAGSVIIASLAFGGAGLAPAGAQAAETVLSDVEENSYYSEPVDVLAEKGVVIGIGDGKFAPNKDVTRAEAVAMIARALNLDTDREVGKAVFTDVTGGWYYGAIAALEEEGVLNGYKDGSFKPNQPVTRAEFAKMVVEAYKLKGEGTVNYTDVKEGAWYSKYIVPIHQKEITQGVGGNKFAPNSHTSRADAATFVYRTLNYEQFGKADGLVPITNITDTTVTINDKEFTVSDDLKGLLTSGNSNVLTDAVIYAQTDKSGVINKIRHLELKKSGEEGTPLVLEGANAFIDGPLVVKGDFVEVKNVTINKDLLIGGGDDSNIVLTGVTIHGSTIVGDPEGVAAAALEVSAGGNITLQDSYLGDMVVHKGNVTIDAKGDSSIGNLLIQKDTKINIAETSSLAQLNISKAVENVEVNGTVANLEINSSKNIKLLGTSSIANLKIINSEAKVQLDPNIKVDSLGVPAGKEADIITNFDQVKKNIQKINASENPDAQPISDDIPSAKTSTVSANYIGQNAIEFIIIVKDASGKALTDLTADAFTVKPREGESYKVGQNANFINFINKGDGQYAVTFAPGYPINESVEVFANDSSIKTGLDVNTTDDAIKATANVSDLTGLNMALDDPAIKTINIVDDFEVSERIIIDHAVTINGGHHTINFVGNEAGWNGKYVMQVYNTKDVSISDLSLKGGDGALLVNSSTVKLTGTIDVTGNEFGGIEVSKGQGENLGTPSLDITDARFVNEDEAYKQPTMWEDKVTGTIIGAEEDFATTNKLKDGQVQYYLDEANIDTTKVSDLKGMKDAIADDNVANIIVTSDFETNERIIVDRAVTINGGGHGIKFTGDTVGWGGNYVMQVYNTEDVTITDLALSGGDGALLVNSSAVKLTGNIDVSGNEFGGIEVSKGQGDTGTPSLDVTDAVIANTGEAYKQPTMWEDKVTDSITGAGDKFSTTSTLKDGQVQYYLDETNINTAKVSDFKGMTEAIADDNVANIIVTSDFETSERIIVDRPVTINGGGHGIKFTGDTAGWGGNYVMQVYNTEDVTITDLALSGGDGALLVNSSAVKLTGNIDVSGNEFGGIEVSKGQGENLATPSLDVTDATFINTTEAYGIPTLWEDKITEAITGADKFTSTNEVKTDQVQYYIIASHATTTTTD